MMFTIITLAVFTSSLMLLLLARIIMLQFSIRSVKFEKFCCWIGWHWKISNTKIINGENESYCTSCMQTGLHDGNGDFFVHSHSKTIQI